MILPLLMLADSPTHEALLARYRGRTMAEQPCPIVASTDITVCGRRRADHFRMTFIGNNPDDPRHEGVPAERERLLKRRTPVEEMGPFLVGGGMVGASVSTGRGQGLRARPLAP